MPSKKTGITKSRKPLFSALIISVIMGTLVLGGCGPNPTDTPPTPTAQANFKVSSVLLSILLTYQTAQGSDEERLKTAIQYARDVRAINSKDEVIFELELDSPSQEKPVTDKIKGMGGIVRNASNLEGTAKLRVTVPVSAFVKYAATNKENFLSDLAAFQGVKAINLLIGGEPLELEQMPQTEAALEQVYQTSQNEGVKLMGADQWQAAGFRGQGVRIGVIDVGYRFYEKFLGKTLPANLEVKDFGEDFGEQPLVQSNIHGTAVTEIIYSLAPEAQIFVTAVDGTDAQYKAAIEYLLEKNVSIISASVGDHLHAGDGTSPIEVYIERIRKEKNVLFLFSAGNEGASHYTQFFSPDADGFHQFAPGVTQLAVGNTSATPVKTYFSLNWEQWGLSKTQVNDLDLFVVDRNGNPVKGGSSQDFQSTRSPIEVVPLTLEAKQLYYIRIRQKPGTPAYTKPFRLHLFGRNVVFQFIVPQMAIARPASSKGAVAVGAINWAEDKWIYYSSQGPLPDGRFKPEISAPTEVSSRAYEEEGRETFGGTSAACPEAAGIAVILKSANPNLSADQLEALLKEATVDLTPAGPDFANGYGRVDLKGLKPAQGIAPQGKAPPAPVVEMASLQFPVLTLQYYPAPQVGPVTKNKVPAPTPLPGRATSLESGATDDSKPNSSGTSSAPTAAATRPAGTPVATPEPILGAEFRDDFKSPISGLPNNGDHQYLDGAYQLKVMPGQLTWGSYPASVITINDFGADVTVQGLSRDGMYGLVFWQQDATNYFLLSMSGQGLYQISQYTGGNYQEIIGWTPAPEWKTTGPNTLRVIASKGTVRVSINNQPGKTGQANGQGGVGFAAGTYGSAPEAATFTNFRLTAGK